MENKDITILIADDDYDYLNQMDFHLNKFGFKTILANSQKECEEIIETKKPNLAIFDLMMENDDSGFILSYKLKKKISRRSCNSCKRSIIGNRIHIRARKCR